MFHKKKGPKPGAAKDSHDPKDLEYGAVVWLRPYRPPPEIPDKAFVGKPPKDVPADKYPYWLCTGCGICEQVCIREEPVIKVLRRIPAVCVMAPA